MNLSRMAMALAASVATTGCPQPDPQGTNNPYDFSSCAADGGDPLCGWVVESGSAELGQSFTAGALALQMHPSTQISLQLSWGDCYDGTIHFTGRCDQGTTLRFDATLRGSPAGTATSDPGTQWQRLDVNLNAAAYGISSNQIPWIKVFITTVGPGSCMLDDIGFGPTYVYGGYNPGTSCQ